MDFQLNLNTETVDQAPIQKPLCAARSITVRQALELLKEHQTGGLLVCEEEKLLGIFTERDALRLMAEMASNQQRTSLLEAPIESVMSPNPVTLSPDDTMAAAIGEMSTGGYRRLPIVDGEGRPTAMLKVSGVLRYLVDHFSEVVYTLPPQPGHAAKEREGA